jgi:hypothetical protein
MAIEYNL